MSGRCVAAREAQVVFFDAVGTLFHPHPGAAEVYATVGRRRGLDLPLQVIQQRFREAFQRQEALDQSNGFVVSPQRERERWQAIVRDVLHELPDSTAAFVALWDHFARPSSWRTYPDVLPCLDQLRQDDVTWGIASNFDERLHDVLPALLGKYVPAIVAVSAEVGYRKPATAFYETLARSAGVSPANTCMVGDDLENDVLGARRAGCDATWLDRNGPTAPGSLRSLAELPDYLRNRRHPCA